MALVQNPLHNSIVEHLKTVLTTSSMHGAENEEEEKTISNPNQRGVEPKIMKITENNRIKIIPYEANITKVSQ